MFTFIHAILFTETSNLIKFKNSHLGKSAPCKYTKKETLIGFKRQFFDSC